MNKEIKRIAIVRLTALGDIVNSAVVLQFIYKKFPNAKIDWFCEETFAPILNQHPLLHKVHPLTIQKAKKQKSFSLLKKNISYLRSLKDFDIVIDMQGLIKSSVVARLISKNTHGFDKKSTREGLASLLYKTSSTIAYTENIVRRNSFVVSDALGFKIDNTMLTNKEKVFPQVHYSHAQNGKKNIVIVIGASWESKRYPKEKVLELCNALEENALILWGNNTEKKDAEWICASTDFATLAPKLSLFELVSFIGSADLLIGNDTGPSHLAWAQNVPSIMLFGPTTTRMMYKTQRNIGIKSPSKVDILKINKNDFSIKEIQVQSILKKAKELLQ